ncbi:MAG: penicillin-binding protein [Patescibacteria group bacterium]
MPRYSLNSKKRRVDLGRVGTKRHINQKKNTKQIFDWEEWFQQTKKNFAFSLQKNKRPAKRLASKTVSKKRISNKSTVRQPEKDLNENLLEFGFKLFFSPLYLIWFILVKVFGLNRVFNFFASLQRTRVAAALLIIMFTVVGIRLAYLQVPYFNQLNQSDLAFAMDLSGQSDVKILPANRGNVFIQDLNRPDKLYQLTSNQSRYKLVLYPNALAKKISADKTNQLKNPLTAEEFTRRLSAATNIDYKILQTKVNDALERNKTKELNYYVLDKEINSEQRQALLNLIVPPKDIKEKPIFFPYYTFINLETITTRTYPERNTLGSTLGFTSSNIPESDAARIKECQEMINKNKSQGSQDPNGYTIGQYGVERTYCSELAGVNGKISYGKVGPNQTSEIKPIDGMDVVLTIDKNIQAKAEQVLKDAVDNNANANGKPVSGTIIVMQAKTGKILAQANYPSIDPNNVTQNDYENGAVKNQASVAYDPGSVVKPLLVAAARDVYEQGKVRADGSRLGVPLDYAEVDSDEEGKIFYGADGRAYVIHNADNRSFKNLGPMSLSDILRNSINTLIATIQKDRMDTETTRDYFINKFKLGESSKSYLFTSDPPNVRNFDENINSPFSYANMAFGQGFTTTPINLLRAYTTLANDGKMVEPRIVDKMTQNGLEVPYTYPEAKQVIKPEVAREVRQMMQNVIEKGFGSGTKPSAGKMEHYTAGAKTGTAQVARPIIKVDENGNKVMIPCSYACNSQLGLFDHTFIGFAPVADPQVIVLVKLSQPKPGDTNNNYAEYSTAAYWRQITEYSLNYLGVPKDR